jgi:hypothetical protein
VGRLTLELEEVVRIELRSVLVGSQGATVLDTSVRIAPVQNTRLDIAVRRLPDT